MKTQQYSSIYTKVLPNGNIQVFTRQHNYLSGEIDLKKKVFYSSPRSWKNIMKIFEGIGLNSEVLINLLPSLGIETIKVLFDGKVLTTTRSKWVKKGISNPYVDSTIDKQIILKLSDINMEPYEITINNKEPELNLFAGAAL